MQSSDRTGQEVKGLVDRRWKCENRVAYVFSFSLRSECLVYRVDHRDHTCLCLLFLLFRDDDDDDVLMWRCRYPGPILLIRRTKDEMITTV